MIPLFKVRMSKAASERVREVLESGYIGQGPRVDEFEELLGEELSTPVRPITVNSCTNAIDLALHLCGVGSEDEVISTPQTCFASQVGMIHRHARIRWADVDPRTGLMDANSIAKLMTKKTKAIVAVNWGGKFCDYRALKSFGIPVIEDAAHTWDVFIKDRTSLERGNYICYSFQAIKFLTCTDGGLLITPKAQEERARLLRWYGLDRTKRQSFRCTQNIVEAGFKYHMNDVCAAIGIANISEASESVLQARENARIYCSELGKCRNVEVGSWDSTCSYWIFTVLIGKGSTQDFINYLNEHGIEASPVHHRNDRYECTLPYYEADLPGTTEFYRRQVNIPVGWWLSKDDIMRIISVCADY